MEQSAQPGPIQKHLREGIKITDHRPPLRDKRQLFVLADLQVAFQSVKKVDWVLFFCDKRIPGGLILYFFYLFLSFIKRIFDGLRIINEKGIIRPAFKF